MYAVSLALLGFAALSLQSAHAQDFPSKPIRVFTTAAGGGSDFTARLVAQGMGTLGQPVIVENRPSGIVAAEIVAKAPADGYSLTVNGGTFIIATLLQKMSYDVIRDFTPISVIERQVSMVVVHPSLPVKSVKELIALAKARPGDLNFASGGMMSSPHLAAELFNSMAGIKMVHIPYKGGGASLNAVLAGEAQVNVVNGISGIAGHLKSGKLRALAVTSATPSELAPGLPTVMATGLPGYEWWGATSIFAPTKTPAPVISRLNQEIVRYLRTAEAKEKFLSAGIEAMGSSVEDAAASLRSEIARLNKVLKDANLLPAQ